MQHIRILAVGKIKEAYLREGLAEYQKRLQTMCKLQIVEIAEEKAPAQPSAAQERQLVAAEGRRILQALAPPELLIALDIQGQALASEQFAAYLEELRLAGRGAVAFAVGGSLGLSEAVLQRADLRLSFGRMTFPHQLMRLILVEQIYRAFKIARNEQYHK